MPESIYDYNRIKIYGKDFKRFTFIAERSIYFLMYEIYYHLYKDLCNGIGNILILNDSDIYIYNDKLVIRRRQYLDHPKFLYKVNSITSYIDIINKEIDYEKLMRILIYRNPSTISHDEIEDIK